MMNVRVRACASRIELGLSRPTNEDAILTGPLVFAVADGMGGHQGGDVASNLAVETLDSLNSSPFVSALDVQASISTAHRLILEEAVRQRHDRPMGTTISGLALIENGDLAGIMTFNVGDSRVYLLRRSDFRQITTDHSAVQELIDEGLLDESTAWGDSRRNIVTRALGIDSDAEPDFEIVAAEDGDRFFISTDGVHDVLQPQEIADLLKDDIDCETAASNLVDRTYALGAPDNFSLVILDIVVTQSQNSHFDITKPISVGL